MTTTSPGFEAGEDLDDAGARAQADLDGTQARRVLRHDVGDEAALAGLDGALGHDERALLRLDARA